MPTAVPTVLSLLALLLAVAAVVLATVANRRWARRPRPGAADDPPSAAPVESLEPDPLAVLGSQLEGLGGEVAELRDRLARATQQLDDVRDLAEHREVPTDPTALRHVALVRYDAFADVGGRLSYSVALLDDTGSGLVLTTLSGKSDVRTYVRTISGGRAEGTLTAEEQQAIDAAVGRGA